MKFSISSLFIKEYDFISYWFFAFVAHIIVLLLCLLINQINVHWPNLWNNNIKLIQSSVRVDVVAMPTMTAQELKEFQDAGKLPSLDDVRKDEAFQAAKEAAQEKVKELEFKEEGKTKSLSEVLKELSQKQVEKKEEKGKKSVSAQKNLSQLSKKDLQSLILAGNKITKGESLIDSKGLGNELSLFERYAAQLPASVRPFWKLPSYLDRNLRCRVRVFISSSGGLISTQMVESSNVAEYDERALSAIKKASPFPQPAAEIVSRLARGEIILGFPL